MQERAGACRSGGVPACAIVHDVQHVQHVQAQATGRTAGERHTGYTGVLPGNAQSRARSRDPGTPYYACARVRRAAAAAATQKRTKPGNPAGTHGAARSDPGARGEDDAGKQKPRNRSSSEVAPPPGHCLWAMGHCGRGRCLSPAARQQRGTPGLVSRAGWLCSLDPWPAFKHSRQRRTAHSLDWRVSGADTSRTLWRRRGWGRGSVSSVAL